MMPRRCAEALERGAGGLASRRARASASRDEGPDVASRRRARCATSSSRSSRAQPSTPQLAARRQDRDGAVSPSKRDDLDAVVAEDLLGHHQVAVLAERERRRRSLPSRRGRCCSARRATTGRLDHLRPLAAERAAPVSPIASLSRPHALARCSSHTLPVRARVRAASDPAARAPRGPPWAGASRVVPGLTAEIGGGSADRVARRGVTGSGFAGLCARSALGSRSCGLGSRAAACRPGILSAPVCASISTMFA